jgi:hypothetical protein
MITSRRSFLGTTMGAAALTMVRPLTDGVALSDQAATASAADVTVARVHAAAGEVVNSFDPDQSLATSMDVQSRESIKKIYTPEMVKVCLSAGWGPISYRLHTPETIDYWHWNAKGRWTDEAKQRGYFVGSSELGEPIHDSFGYSLPHRGCTHNGGTDVGYSRLTDGDPGTFWKSNPYLSKEFTHEDDSLHPQWIIVDLGKYYDVNAIRIIGHGCQGYANWGNALWDREGKIIGYTAFYHAGRMINEEWVTHRSGVHHLHTVDVGIEDAAGNELVTSYAVRRPDGHWALMLINKDRDHAHSVRIAFGDGGKTGYFSRKARVVTFGSEQYVWHGEEASAHADPNLPPVISSVDASAQTVFTLPKASVTVLRGEVAGLTA